MPLVIIILSAPQIPPKGENRGLTTSVFLVSIVFIVVCARVFPASIVVCWDSSRFRLRMLGGSFGLESGVEEVEEWSLGVWRV